MNSKIELTDHQAQVKLCSYFFKYYCKKRKTKTDAFGKFPIEKMFGTYIHQSAFMEALLMTDTKMYSTDYGDLKFDIVVEKQYRDMIIFYGWKPAPMRWLELEAIPEQDPNFCK